MKLSQAIKEFTEWRSMKVRANTLKGYNMILRQFCLFVRDCEIEEVKLKDVTEWFHMMDFLEWGVNSFMPKAMALRKFFEFWTHQGYQVLDPWLIDYPKKEFNLPRVADDEHYHKLLETIPLVTNDPRHIRNRAIITLLYDTGARHGEILGLNLPELNVEKKKAIIRTEKNRGSRPFRELFWTNDTNEHIVRWLKKRMELQKKVAFAEPEAVFISICAGQYKTQGRRFTIKGSGEMMRRYCSKAGVPYMNAHSFRHKKTRDILTTGGNIADAMNINGWASINSGTPYSKLWDKALEDRARIFLNEPGEREREMSREFSPQQNYAQN